MKHIIYCRKSSEAEDRQVLSIESQENELLRLAEKEQIQIGKIYKESMSAKEPGRPIFEEMLKHIEKNQNCALLVWKLDRLARNALDGGKVSWFMDRGLISEIRTPEKVFKNISDDKFMMSLDFGIAKKYVDDLSTNVKRGIRAKLEKGGWPGLAPMGYLNNRADQTILVDDKKAPFLVRAFELYASGGYSLKEIANILYQEGFRTKAGIKVRKGVIHAAFKNPFYIGIMLKQGKYYQGNHKPIISKELYDKVRYVLDAKNHSKKQRHFFHARGFLNCAVCGCLFTATTKKSHKYYYCTNGKGICNQHKKYFKSKDVDGLLASIFSGISFDEELVELAYQAAKQKTQNNQEYFNKSLEALKNQLELNKQKQSKLADRDLAGLVSESLYKDKITALNNEQITLGNEIKKLEQSYQKDNSTLEQTKEVFLKASRAKKVYLVADDFKKREILETLLWNISIKNQKVAQVKLKMPYQLMLKRHKKFDFSKMRRREDSNLCGIFEIPAV